MRTSAPQAVLGLISLVPISAQMVLLVFPVTSHTTPKEANSSHSLPWTSLQVTWEPCAPLYFPLCQVLEKNGGQVGEYRP